MELKVRKNKKTGQLSIFLKKKELKMMGVDDPKILKLYRGNFVNGKKNKKTR